MVVTEVIHNLFKNHIRNVLVITHKIINKPHYRLSHEEKIEIGDIETSKRLHSLIPKQKIQRLVNTGEFSHSIEQLMKGFKLQFPQHRDYLEHYYKNSVQTYSDFERKIGFKIITPNSDETTQFHALNHIKFFQLGPADAIHLALTAQHNINYFATLDSDFVHTYYSEVSIGTVRILKVA
ncbi:PIN domain-containing protein [Aquibacillus koreensis]|uniref:PIN domain-containing protein n=1 Tax=Aquibacillus koreensis TaxID=279446 RepID=A0A9X3WLL0_9BACI|nr:PIN domain-containing protein [Aquibacillus koreensis]MCT2534850.1 PIN domain-containing protein [Aquibacillus koreensis]MDC3419539.1 PIN domain-containing protein [Aquibacillus koreensis]